MPDANSLRDNALKIVTGVTTAVLIFVATAIYSAGSTLAVLVNRMDNLDQKLVSIDNRFERYQTKEQARSEKETQSLRDQMIHEQIKQLREILEPLRNR